MQNGINIAMYMYLTSILPNLQKTWQTINETLNRTKGKRDDPQEFKLANGNIISDLKKIPKALIFF